MACGAGHELSRPEVLDFFALTISRVMPKSYYQAWYETKVCVSRYLCVCLGVLCFFRCVCVTGVCVGDCRFPQELWR